MIEIDIVAKEDGGMSSMMVQGDPLLWGGILPISIISYALPLQLRLATAKGRGTQLNFCTLHATLFG